LLAAAVVSSSGVARAYDPKQQRLDRVQRSAPKALAPAEPATLEEPTRWYGWQTLTVDGLATGAFLATVLLVDDMDARGLGAGASFTAWFVGAPAIHIAHRRVARGFISLGLRLALPLAGAGLALATCSGSGEFACLGPAMVGITAGIAAPSVIDAVWLAYEPPKSKPKRAELGSLFQVGISVLPNNYGLVLRREF
jgi:hypothetical protein